MDPTQAYLQEVRQVLAMYHAEFHPASVECLDDAGGFSGARFWRLQTSHGPLCLRRWPSEHPCPEQLEFIHSVLWFAEHEGFDLAPVPIPTLSSRSFVETGNHLWQLEPWMPGRADYLEDPRPEKLSAAMVALAQFHVAVEGFPVVDAGPSPSPGCVARLKKLKDLRSGQLTSLDQAIHHAAWVGRDEYWADIAACSRRIVQLAKQSVTSVEEQLEGAARLGVRILPCLRDVWSDHLLFEGERVSGIVDFGAMRPESVAADISRLLGSMVGDHRGPWTMGLAAYESVRRLERAEHQLVGAMDQSSVLMSGLNWIEWIFLEGRKFDRPEAILPRLLKNEIRLRTLVAKLR